MKRLILRLIADNRGATAVEYGVLCALIFLVIISAVAAFSETGTGILIQAAQTLAAAMSNA